MTYRLTTITAMYDFFCFLFRVLMILNVILRFRCLPSSSLFLFLVIPLANITTD